MQSEVNVLVALANSANSAGQEKELPNQWRTRGSGHDIPCLIRRGTMKSLSTENMLRASTMVVDEVL
jgi:hypothetical protein